MKLLVQAYIIPIFAYNIGESYLNAWSKILTNKVIKTDHKLFLHIFEILSKEVLAEWAE